VPHDLATIVAKCLSKEPEHRYPTAAELAADLERFVRGGPIGARPVGPVERFARWVRRKPTAAAAYGFSSLAVLLAVVVLVVLGFWHDAEGARGLAENERTAAEAAKKDAEAARDQLAHEKKFTEVERDKAVNLKGIADGALGEAVRLKGIAEALQAKEAEDNKRERAKLRVNQYGSTIQLAHQEWRDNNIVGARTMLDGTPSELRGWEWQYVHRLCHGSLLTLKGHQESVTSACFNLDGSRVATGSEDGTAKVWDTKTGAAHFALDGHTGRVDSVSFSADGSLIVTASSDKTAKVWNAKTGKELRTLRGHAEALYSACFSADGSRVVTASYDKTAKVWDAKVGADVGADVVVIRGRADRAPPATRSIDGSELMVEPDGMVQVRDFSGAARAKLQWHHGTVAAAAFSPDGSQIVTAGWDGTTRIWDARTGAERVALTGHTGRVLSACFSPDGRRIVTGGSDRTARVWDVLAGVELATLRGHADAVSSAAFNGNGSRIVTGSTDKTAKVWDARTGAEVLTLRGHTDGVESVSFAPDGWRVLTRGRDGVTRVWNARPLDREFLLPPAPPPRQVGK
jgi:WD40 repeat protein